MKSFTLGVTLLSLSAFANADTTVVSELLVGKSLNKIHTARQADAFSGYDDSLWSNSFGFRLGVELNDYLTVELAKHLHGEAKNEFTVTHSNSIPGSADDGFERVYHFKIPTEVESTRLGVKGQVALVSDVFAHARVGIAHWQYKSNSPARLVNRHVQQDGGDSGNDVYAGLGFKYQISDSLHVGLEYSFFVIKETKVDDYTGPASYKHYVNDVSAMVGWTF
ncbi:outer membrane beta-barrel protein [Pseudoalteromonas sp. T1lg65]|uniref:outer membrane beta-barrel protein n=1 Tax=Pseudoalteromonas sp. T1lg65 TaxID=2077101 RepID=UPI003F7A5C85